MDAKIAVGMHSVRDVWLCIISYHRSCVARKGE